MWSAGKSGYGDSGGGGDRFPISVNKRTLADDESASAFLLRIAGFFGCGVLFFVGIALFVGR